MEPTRTGKLLARKRPHLIPGYDDVIERWVEPKQKWWRIISEFFSDSNRLAAVSEVREEAGAIEVLSLPRTLDVVLWMRYRGPVEG